MALDVIAVVEAAYRVESPERAWMQGILAAARTELDAGLGTFSFSYDTPGPGAFELRTLVAEGCPDALIAGIGRALAELPADFIRQGRAAPPCSLGSEIPGFLETKAIAEHMHPVGVRDVFGVHVLDPTGVGCYIGAPLPRVGKLAAGKRASWKRVAAHVAAAFRVQRELARGTEGDPLEHAEAVLDPTGVVEHAVGVAKLAAARRSLREAALACERARTTLRHEAPVEALEKWRGLVAARWTLLDHFERDGRKYILARRNDPRARGPGALTARERQVLGYAVLGHENKLIAYELGISPSTVRVLIARASAKLGADSRADAIRRFREAVAAGDT